MPSPAVVVPQHLEESVATLVCRPMEFGRIPREAWDRLLAKTPAATPFSRWTVHRAWWDAYGDTAHDQYMVCLDASHASETSVAADRIAAIVPLMHRHELEPDDALTATVLRRRRAERTHVRPEAKAIFFGAAYHTDYATILCAADDLPKVTTALAHELGGPPDVQHGTQEWDVVDLRRLRSGDPTLSALEAALGSVAGEHGWTVVREQEDVCPVVTVEADDWEGYLGTLGKKSRHEIRRKVRRAEAAGALRLHKSEITQESIERFIALHQARFGTEGLFPDTEGGRRSRKFVHRLAELESVEADGGQLELPQVFSGDRLIFAALAFDDGRTCYLYNAGMDPDAGSLSPGVTGTAAYFRDRIEAGRRRLDFLRGDEDYKYEWGARDEPIERVLVLRGAAA